MTSHPTDADKLSCVLKLAFENERVVSYAEERLRNKLEYTNVAYSLLPRRFWRTLFPTQPSFPRRLLLYWLLVAAIATAQAAVSAR